MVIHSSTLERIIEYSMQLENKLKPFILLELLKRSEDWFVFMKRRNMDLMMEILLLLERSKE